MSQVFTQLYRVQSFPTLAGLVLSVPEPLRLNLGCQYLFFPFEILLAWLRLLRRDLLKSFGKNIYLFLLIELVFILNFLLCWIVYLIWFLLSFFDLGFDQFINIKVVILFEMNYFELIFVKNR